MKNPNIKTTNGIIETSKISEFHLSKNDFYKLIKENNYEKVGPGIYVSPDEFVDELLVLHKRCPSGVISHDEALYHYGLIDREPVTHTITVYSGYNASRLKKSGYQVYFVNKNMLEFGKEMVSDHFGNKIPMYNMERTIVDLIRNRSKFEIQDFKSALRNYAASPNKNLRRLHEYAKAFRVTKVLQRYLEVLI